MNNIKAVIFDMDGIIFDTERLILDCWVELAKQRKIEGNIREVFSACIGTNREKTKEIVLSNLGDDFPYEEFAGITSKMFWEKAANGGIPIKSGVRDTLETFKTMGMPLGLASSTRLEIVREELGAADLLKYFDVVVGGDLINRSKPEPDIYLLACEKIGFEPAECIAVEDSYNGIISAYRAGLHPIMIPDLLVPTPEMDKMSETILQSMEELIPWLKQSGLNPKD